MNINDKRLALKLFCETRFCTDCRKCNGMFKDHNGEVHDDIIRALYDTVFGDKPDMVNSPKHYALPGDMEVIDVEVATQGVEAVKEHCVCAAIEYLLRHKKKNGDEDVRKAQWWLSKYVELTEKETE